MPLKTSKYIWHEGKLVPWEQATVHVLSHALHYGSSVFEGIRALQDSHGRRGFSFVRPHSPPLSVGEDLPHEDSVHERGARDGMLRGRERERAVRRRVHSPDRVSRLRRDGRGRQHRTTGERVGGGLGMGLVPWRGGLEQGVDVCVSSWQRVAPNTVPALAKAGGNYLSSALVTLEARRLGFTEGLALNTAGFVSEGAGENLFLGARRQALHAARRVVDIVGPHAQLRHRSSRSIPVSRCSSRTFRASSCTSPTKFFSWGTAAEITPVRSVDKIAVGLGKRGPITEHLQKMFFGLFDGSTADRWGWLEPIVDQKAGRNRPVAGERRNVVQCCSKNLRVHVVVPETGNEHPPSCTSTCTCCTRLRRRRRSIPACARLARAPHRIARLATLDHSTPTVPITSLRDLEIVSEPSAAKQVRQMERNCKDFGIELRGFGSRDRGIVHVMGRELGATQPGATTRLRRLATRARTVRSAPSPRHRHDPGRPRARHAVLIAT